MLAKLKDKDYLFIISKIKLFKTKLAIFEDQVSFYIIIIALI